MCINKLLLSILFFVLALKLDGQIIHFNYDNSGNRVSRYLIIEELKGNVQFPVKDINELPVIETEEHLLAQKEIPFIYPNPNNGILKIEGLNIPSDTEANIWIYDLSGVALVSKKESSNSFELNISNLSNGVYILIIKVGDKLFNWKIIKRY